MAMGIPFIIMCTPKSIIIPDLSKQCINFDTADVYSILLTYVDDFRNDRYASTPMNFGVEVPGEGTWTIDVTGRKIEDSYEVIVTEGKPSNPTFIYKIEYNTLLAINAGFINALTAQGKAFSGDYTPMSIINMDR